MNDVCKLCGRRIELRLSHIISKFCFKGMTNEKGEKEVLYFSENQPKKRLKDGIKEYLLCGNCEEKFSDYESHLGLAFKELLWDKACSFSFSNGIPADSNKYRKAKVKYEKFFLGILSMYWRLCVSKTNKCSMDLGPYLDKIKRIFLGEETLPQERLNLIVSKLMLGNFDVKDIVWYRGKSRISNSHVCHTLWLNGYSFCLILGNGKLRSEYAAICLKTNGEIYVPVYKIENSKDFKRIQKVISSK